MANLSTLFEKYDRLFLFDMETTGLGYSRDEIIEFAAVIVELREGIPTIIKEYDELITLTPGNVIPDMIVNLTGITNEAVKERGIPKEQLCREIAGMFTEKTLLLAYNGSWSRTSRCSTATASRTAPWVVA